MSTPVIRDAQTGNVIVVLTGSPDSDRDVAARAINGLLDALDREGISHGWDVEGARVHAELLLEDWGFDRSGAAQ